MEYKDFIVIYISYKFSHCYNKYTYFYNKNILVYKNTYFLL